MKPRLIRVMPGVARFAPIDPDGLPTPMGEPIHMTHNEFEAFRLVFHEGLLLRINLDIMREKMLFV